MASLQNGDYQEAFKQFRVSGNEGELALTLKNLLDEFMSESEEAQPEEKTNAEVLEMALQTDFKDTDWGKILRNAFEIEKDVGLLFILDNFSVTQNYEKLVSDLQKYAASKPAAEPEVFADMNQAIDCFVTKGKFSQDEGQTLKDLYS